MLCVNLLGFSVPVRWIIEMYTLRNENKGIKDECLFLAGLLTLSNVAFLVLPCHVLPDFACLLYFIQQKI